LVRACGDVWIGEQARRQGRQPSGLPTIASLGARLLNAVAVVIILAPVARI
jgi:hypothetical protein